MDIETPVEGAVRLEHLGVIRAQGADAVTFLQGQLTNDVATLDGAHARLAGFCSAKGRLQASFVIWKGAPDEVLLACSASLLAPTLKRLAMFVLRAKCRLSDATSELPLWGFAGTPARERTGDAGAWEKHDLAHGAAIRLPDVDGEARSVVVGGSAGDPEATNLSLEHWRWLEVRSGVPTIEAATVDRFVPQMLNYELIGGVDFQKGCYPGQEVVARSHYRGSVKRRMFLFECDVATAPGSEVFHDADPAQPAGMVVNAACGPDGRWSALVETKLAALEGGTLHLDSIQGAAMRRAALPYAVP